jgi:hypothetical protein
MACPVRAATASDMAIGDTSGKPNYASADGTRKQHHTLLAWAS